MGELKDEDRTEALILLRMESRDGGHLTWLDPIIRTGDDVTLGEEGMVRQREMCLNGELLCSAVRHSTARVLSTASRKDETVAF